VVKKKGRFCWSIHCREKVTAFNQTKCRRCKNVFCYDCIEIWEDGYKGCPNCSLLRKAEKENDGEPILIRKPRKSPEQKLREMEEKFKNKIQKMKNKNMTQEDIDRIISRELSDSGDKV